MTGLYQNAGLEIPGAVAQFDKNTGEFYRTLVSHSSPDAPWSARGISYLHARKGLPNSIVVADPGEVAESIRGALRIYDYRTGEQIQAFDAPLPIYMPRAVVVGPDGKLYVAAFDEREGMSDLGWILRFDPITGFELPQLDKVNASSSHWVKH